MTPRVVRFGDEPASEPDRAAPVARFGEDTPERARAADADPAADEDQAGPGPAGERRSVDDAGSAGMFDDLGSLVAAPVASVGDPARTLLADGRTRGAESDRPPVAAIAGTLHAPGPEVRTAALTGLVPGGRGRRRGATPTPGGGSTKRAAPPPAVADEPADRALPGRWATTGRGEAGAAPVTPDDPAAANEPGQGGRSGARETRRGGGGLGGRGAPAELDPDADPVAVAKEVCLRLLTDRARTRQELAQALRRKGVPDDAARTVLERFDEVGLIDDAAFAGQWVRSRHNHRGLARRAIAMELRRKGVDDEVASEALGEVDQESEERRARELVDRKLRTVPAGTPEQRRKAATRLVGMLARKGYGGGIAYRVVREALAARGAEIDELGTDPPD
jgi:regulatory protein